MYTVFERQSIVYAAFCAIPAICHFAQQLSVSAAKLGVLLVVVLQKVGEWQAAIVAAEYGCYMLVYVAQSGAKNNKKTVSLRLTVCRSIETG